MDGDPTEDVEAMQHCLRLESQGKFFKQIWSKVPETDSDLQTMIKAEQTLWDVGALELSRMRKESSTIEAHTLEHSADWRLMNKTSPIASGGINPVLLPKLLDTVGTIDFIVTMGGGVHSHPMETTAGAKAVVEAFSAWQNGQTLEEASHDHVGHDKELETAIRYFDKHGTQAHRVEQTPISNVEQTPTNNVEQTPTNDDDNKSLADKLTNPRPGV